MAALALGLIALALAAHLWFIRGELRRYLARNATPPRDTPLPS
jgi:hypothetical protein